ncbi:hypothetical protein [Kibdelosporangium philippinense]|uniref:hypothetical protein n=1 Tax=Kibdelosporangium philippinense TaxID=211113 RepID=UPI0036198F29
MARPRSSQSLRACCAAAKSPAGTWMSPPHSTMPSPASAAMATTSDTDMCRSVTDASPTSIMTSLSATGTVVERK